MVYDEYCSHLSLDVPQLFFDGNVIVYALASHTFGTLQPLDVVLFTSLNTYLQTMATNVFAAKNGEMLNHCDFCSILSSSYHQSLTL